MSFVLSRRQLYDLVWSEPMQRLAKQIGISDVALAKSCRKIDVPVPERGYWNKLHAGKRVHRVELSPADLGTAKGIEISGTLSDDLKSRLAANPESAIEEKVEILMERFAKRLGKVTVPKNFDKAHPLIAKLLEKDEAIRQAKLTERFSWREPMFESAFERRRLRILNAIYLAFARVGGSGWTRGPLARELSVFSVTFTLDRPNTKRQDRYYNERSSPDTGETGPLALTIEAYQPPQGLTLAWRDEPDLPLEARITEVVLGIAVAAEELRREGERRHKIWLEQRRLEEEREAARLKIELARKEKEHLAQLEKARIDALLNDAVNLERAARLRDYVDAVLRQPPTDVEPEHLDIWAAFVQRQADILDPRRSGRLVTSIDEAVESAQTSDYADPSK